jgi:ribosomal protein L24E
LRFVYSKWGTADSGATRFFSSAERKLFEGGKVARRLIWNRRLQNQAD